MPSVRQLKRRIRSVENTAKITKAMSMIAASKMRRAQEAAIRGRPYADRIELLRCAHAGPGAARNAGLRVADGELIALL
ncbi:MAG: F0F1 ATP synthase subunit gamma, partial [Acidobacteria bacterium]|nr:F0F1 ATP synthase subunit gamma [Acidobacteriota bacterium]